MEVQIPGIDHSKQTVPKRGDKESADRLEWEEMSVGVVCARRMKKKV